MDSDVESDVATACDFSALAGTWRGEVEGDAVGLWDAFVTLEPTADIDARIGIIQWTTLTTQSCTSELLCTGRNRLGFEVTKERGIENPELCVDEYCFFRPEADGTVAFEFAYGEFDAAAGTGTLSRVE